MNFATKFRAFQLDSPGSLFSFYKENTYTLIEARLPKGGIKVLEDDLAYHSKAHVDVLHITSWDADHCTYDDLVTIINHLRPQLIEVPSYTPDSNDASLCRGVIFKYDAIHQKYVQNVRVISKEYISSLEIAPENGTNNVIFNSHFDDTNKNDMSLIQLFRSPGFNVLSVGDCESDNIAKELMGYSFIRNQVDVFILAHHGAANGFTTTSLIDSIKPKIAICSSNYGNHYDHPRPEVVSIFQNRGIPLMTTKRGDVVVYATADNPGEAIAVNMISDNEIEESREGFITKKKS